MGHASSASITNIRQPHHPAPATRQWIHKHYARNDIQRNQYESRGEVTANQSIHQRSNNFSVRTHATPNVTTLRHASRASELPLRISHNATEPAAKENEVRGHRYPNDHHRKRAGPNGGDRSTQARLNIPHSKTRVDPHQRRSQLKANATTIDITPSWATDLGAGPLAENVRTNRSAQEPLEANLLAIWANTNSQPVLLVTLDLLYAGKEIRTAVENAAHKLPQENIIVAASHTHRAPMTDTTKPRLGRADPSYIKWLTNKLAHAVREVLSLAKAENISLHAGINTASHSINRRRFARLALRRKIQRNVYVSGPNIEGPRDETVTVVTINDAQGRPIAILWNYSCHPVAHPDSNTYSSHYPHWTRDAYRTKRNNPRLPVLFFQGFSGDTRPNASIGIPDGKGLIRRIFSGPQFRDMTRRRYRNWATSLAEKVCSTPTFSIANHNPAITCNRIARPGKEFADGLNRAVAFHTVKIGSELTIVAVSAEAVTAYAHYVRSRTKSKYTICAGCVDDVYGYMPTEEMVRQGGYESAGFTHNFALGHVPASVESSALAAFDVTLGKSESSDH